MYLFTSHRDDAKRYFAHLDLPTHPLCWLRGHKAKAEVIRPSMIGPWLLVTCRTCGIRHSDPYLSRGERIAGDQAAEVLDRQHHAAEVNNAAFARVRDGRDGYGHHRLELSVEVSDRNIYRTPGARVRVGDRWSETPFDWSIHLRKRAIYGSIGGVGNRLAERITGGKKREFRVGARHTTTPAAHEGERGEG